jgi:DNA-binding CsgD family transcriptional regulator
MNADDLLAAIARTDAALDRLAAAGPVSEIVACAPREAAAAAGLARVLLSRVDDGALVVEAAYGTQGALDPVPLTYPLIEGELLRRRRAAIVAADEPAARQAYWEAMRWRGYVAAPILLGGRAVGFLHGDGDGPPEPVECEALARFAKGFAVIYERAVLLQRLRDQRLQLRRIADWADARCVDLSDGVIDLAHDREAAPLAAHGRARIGDLLTARETDVLEHMVTGESNAEIARALVVSEGTVKFHVKNILRKMNVANRAEATAHYLRSSPGAGA